jgi:aspartate kinase
MLTSIMTMLHCAQELKGCNGGYCRTADQLGIDRSIIAGLLEELESLLTRIGSDRELSDCTKDELVSFGERLSTRIFAAYLNKIGRHSQQYDAFDLGVITTDEFTNAEIVETTYPTVLRRLQEESERCKKFARGPTIPVVTGFLGKVGDIMKLATCPFHHAKEV